MRSGLVNGVLRGSGRARFLDDQQRNTSGANHALGDAAEEKPREAPTPVRPDEDPLAALLCSHSQDPLGRRVLPNNDLHLNDGRAHVMAAQLPDHAAQILGRAPPCAAPPRQLP